MKSGDTVPTSDPVTCRERSPLDSGTAWPTVSLQSLVLSCTVHWSGIPTQKLPVGGVNSELHDMLKAPLELLTITKYDRTFSSHFMVTILHELKRVADRT